MASDSLNNDKNNVLSVLQDSFIQGKIIDMVNDTNNVAVVTQNHCLVHDAQNDTLESLRSTGLPLSSSFPFICSRMGNVEPVELVITRWSLPLWMNLSWLACAVLMFSSHAKSMFSIRFRVGVELFSGSLDRDILERENVKGQIQEDVDPELDI